ncbi:MAG: GAF domain-containing protein [Elusimicrobiota bacterium]
MNSCPKCDKIILTDYKFCPKCGYSIAGDSSETTAAAPPAPLSDTGTDARALKFFNVAQSLSTANNIDQLLNKIGQAVEDLLDAERSSIMLIDESGENLYFKSATGEDILKKLKIPLGHGVAGWIAQNRKADIVNDPYNDARFSPETDKKTGFRTNSIIGAPMILGDDLVGIVEAINKKNGKFSDHDMETLLGFAGLAAISIADTKLKTDQNNFFSNMLDFLVMGSEALGHPEPSPKGHTWEIARYAPQIGKELEMTTETLHLLNHAALIHDIGFLGLENTELVGIKIDIDLNDVAKFKLHPVIGAEMIKGIKTMKNLSSFILYHHRYRNGTGFPENIDPDKITEEMEVISILEDYFTLGNKETIDPCRYSPRVFQAFSKIVP